VISPALLAEVQPLASKFADAGYRMYLVGGIVRDQQLGRELAPGSDIDLTTDAHPATIKKLVSGLADAVWSQGERFGTIGCRIAGREYEITTHRGESYDPGSRKPEVVFSDAIEHDLARRDFTVNAMAVALPEGRLVDPYGGRHDLAAAVLRTPLSPEVSFSDDPLRMLRAARFVAGYALTPEPGLLAALGALAPRMAIVSVERRRDELDKLLAVPDPRPGLRLVLEQGLAPFVLPELAKATQPVVDRALDAVAAMPPSRALRLAALVAPDDRPDRAAVDRRLRELRYSNDLVAQVRATVAGAATVVATTSPFSDADIRRFAAVAGAHIDDALRLASTRVDTADYERAVDELRTRESLDALEPALDGEQVMALLHLTPGAAVGEAIAFLRSLRIEEGPLSADEARDRLRVWWGHRSAPPTEPD
jgi:poly(A) polymerase